MAYKSLKFRYHRGEDLDEDRLKQIWRLRVEMLELTGTPDEDWRYFSAFVRRQDTVVLAFYDRSDVQGFITISTIPTEHDGVSGLLLFSKYFYFRSAYRGHYKAMLAPWVLLPIAVRRYGLRRLHFVASTYPQSFVSLSRSAGNVRALRSDGISPWQHAALTSFVRAFFGDNFDEQAGVIRNQNVVNALALPHIGRGHRLGSGIRASQPELAAGLHPADHLQRRRAHDPQRDHPHAAKGATSHREPPMGRRSLKQQRTEQILDAFARCVTEHGLAGATLERTAESAGLGRPAIRHNIGNRDALIEASLERIATQHKSAYAALADALPDRGRVDALLHYLFVGPFSDPLDEQNVLLDELFAVRHREPRVAELLAEIYRDLEDAIARELLQEHARAGEARCHAVAYHLMALAFGHTTFSGLALAGDRGAALLVQARALVAMLGEPDQCC